MPDVTEPIDVPVEPIEPLPLPISPARRDTIVTSTEDVLRQLKPLIREEDVEVARCMAQEVELSVVLKYLEDTIPNVKEYLRGMADASDEEKIAVIKSGLKARAESMVPDYEMPPPFLGNDIEEARGKQEDAETRYKTQYGQIPMVKPIYRGRSAVDNPYYNELGKTLKVKRNPKPTRMKFL